MGSVELRHAPFIGWIHDLSAQDPVLHPADSDGCNDVRDPETVSDSGHRPVTAEDFHLYAGDLPQSSSCGSRQVWCCTISSVTLVTILQQQIIYRGWKTRSSQPRQNKPVTGGEVSAGLIVLFKGGHIDRLYCLSHGEKETWS